jgi:hypothetical protein
LGWSTEKGDSQAPVGFDRFGYSIRDIGGTIFHCSRGQASSEDISYAPGDVIGFFIFLTKRLVFIHPPFIFSLFSLFLLPLLHFSFQLIYSSHSLLSTSHSLLLSPHYTHLPTPTLPSLLHIGSIPFPFILPFFLHSCLQVPIEASELPALSPWAQKENKSEELPSRLIGSKIIFVKNGKPLATAFYNIFQGTYYPGNIHSPSLLFLLCSLSSHTHSPLGLLNQPPHHISFFQRFLCIQEVVLQPTSVQLSNTQSLWTN